MGIVEQMIKEAPHNKAIKAFIGEFFTKVEHAVIEEYGLEGYDGIDMWLVNPNEFDAIWLSQCNIKRNNDTEDKWRKIAMDGRLICVEIDY